MASLRQVGSKYHIRFQDKRRAPPEQVYAFRAENYSKREIQALKKELEVMWEQGAWDPWSGRLPAAGEGLATITLKEAAEAYCEHKRQMGLRRQKGGWNANTHEGYLTRFRALARELGERRQVAQLRSGDLARYIHADDVAPETQKTRRRYVSTFVKWCLEMGYARAGELRMPPAIVLAETLGTYCTEDELEAICRAHLRLLEERQAKKHAPKTGPSAPMARAWMAAAWRVAFYQGLRRGELLAMRVGGLDLARGLMAIGDKTFVPKDKKEAVIALTPPAAAVLGPLLVGRAPAEHVWPQRHRKQISNAFKAAVRRAVKDGGLPAEKSGLHLHNLRDSGCMYWLRKGVDVLHVRDLLRHKDLKVTLQHYYHVEAEEQSEAFRRAYEGKMAGERGLAPAENGRKGEGKNP